MQEYSLHTEEYNLHEQEYKIKVREYKTLKAAYKIFYIQKKKKPIEKSMGLHLSILNDSNYFRSAIL